MEFDQNDLDDMEFAGVEDIDIHVAENTNWNCSVEDDNDDPVDEDTNLNYSVDGDNDTPEEKYAPVAENNDDPVAEPFVVLDKD
jgi:hypothetical protein